MLVTRAAILAKANELSLELTEAEISHFERDQKLPEKPAEIPDSIDEIVTKFDHKTTATLLKKTRDEAARRRRRERELEGQVTTLSGTAETAEALRQIREENQRLKDASSESDRKIATLTTQITELKVKAETVPGMTEQLTTLNQTLTSIKESEKTRRKAKLDTLEEDQRTALDYLLDPDKVTADRFDRTIELLVGKKGNGSGAKLPGESDPWFNKNPWKKETKNITAQIELKRTNLELAKKLMAGAGVTE